MPILKYKCNDCGKEFAKIVVNPEKVPTSCPVCAAGNIEEQGAAFTADQAQIVRALCMGCDDCGSGTCDVAHGG